MIVIYVNNSFHALCTRQKDAVGIIKALGDEGEDYNVEWNDILTPAEELELQCR